MDRLDAKVNWSTTRYADKVDVYLDYFIMVSYYDIQNHTVDDYYEAIILLRTSAMVSSLLENAEIF